MEAMTKEEIKSIMFFRGYELCAIMPSNNRFLFSAYFQKGSCVMVSSGSELSIENNFSITCDVGIDGLFEFTATTSRMTFILKSGKYSPVTRDDFDKIQSSFVFYANQISIDNPF